MSVTCPGDRDICHKAPEMSVTCSGDRDIDHNASEMSVTCSGNRDIYHNDNRDVSQYLHYHKKIGTKFQLQCKRECFDDPSAATLTQDDLFSL